VGGVSLVSERQRSIHQLDCVVPGSLDELYPRFNHDGRLIVDIASADCAIHLDPMQVLDFRSESTGLDDPYVGCMCQHDRN
jgi:hypothetical protein